MRHMLGNLSPNYFERTKRYMMLRASRQGTDLTVSGTPPLSLPNSLGKPLKAWSVDLLPYQEGTGDPSPSNVRPIHGTNQISFVTAGVNLLNIIPQSGSMAGIDYSVDNDGYITLNGANPTNALSVILIEHIQPIPLQITLSSDVMITGGIYTGLVQQNGNTGLLELRPGYTQNTSSESGILQETRYRIYIPNGNSYDNFKFRIMLNFGTTALPYTPYIAHSQTVLTLPQTVYAGTIGSEGGESRDAMVDMGDMTWDRVGSAGRFYSSSIRTLVKAGSDADGYDNAFAETYKAQNVASLSFLSDYCMSVDTSGNVQLYDSSKAGMTGAELKTALSGIKMVYKLATPVQFALSAPTIPTPTGTATTWATAEDGTVDSMEVTYVGKA